MRKGAKSGPERKRRQAVSRSSEEQLRAEQGFFESLIDSLPGIFYLYDDQLRFLRWNKDFQRVSGYTGEEVAAMSPLDFFAGQERELVRERIQEVFAKGTSHVEADFVAKDGTHTRFFFTGAATEVGGKRCLLGVGIDISELRRSEEKLRATEERLRLALDAGQIGTFDWDIPNDRIVWSRRHEELWGFAPGEFPGTYQALTERVHADDIDGLNQEVARCLAQREPFAREFRTVWPDGTVHWVVGRGQFAFDRTGKALRMRGVVFETTPQKRAQEHIRRLSRLYSVLSKANEAILRIHDVNQLCQEVCRIAVEEGDLRMAWVGFVNPADGRFVPVARWGAEDGYLDAVSIVADPKAPWGCGPTGTAVRQGQPVLCNDFAQDPRVAPWRAEGLARGYFSSAAFPLMAGQEVIGALSLYAMEKGFFSEEKADLLQRLAGNISLAIERERRESERKQAEEALRVSEERFHKAFHASPDAISLATLRDGRYLDVNEGFLRLSGYRRAEIIGRTGQEIGLWDQPRDRERLVQKLSQGQGVHGEEFVFRVATGERRTGLVSADVIEAGGEQCLLTVARDITDRKQAEEKLRASEERFRKAFMTGADAFYISTLTEGRIIEANERFLDVFGYTREEAVGKTTLGLGLFADPSDRQRMVGKLRASGHVQNLPLMGRNKAGKAITILISASLLQRGEEELILGVVRDVTQQKRAEEALQRLNHAVMASGEVVFMTDREGTITFVNPEFTRLYGYTAEDVVGKVTPRILKSGEMGAAVYADFWRRVLRMEIVKHEFINRTKAGKLVTVEVSVNPISDDHGDPVGFLAIQRDITARKELEEQFLQAQKMEAVGRLAGGVAHDFNNLLGVIMGYSDLLLEQLPGESKEYKRIEQIKKAGLSAAAITRQLLAFSRKQVMESRVLELNGVLADTEKLLRRLIGEDIELVIRPGRDLGMVRADPAQIEQVIMNLAINARDAMPQGGRLIVETSNEELDEDYVTTHRGARPGPYVVVAVGDTGQGMDAETQARIFEPFFTTKEKSKGTGLGLSTVYGIVKQSGGYIWTDSQLGKGTVFKVYLPRVDAAPEHAPMAEVENVSRGSETILLVEDSEPLRALAKESLEQGGYRVIEARDGAEAIEICARRQAAVDLLLTDVVMPGMSGLELAQRLSSGYPSLKVVFMSGYTDDALGHRGLLDQGVTLLQKPFTRDALMTRVRRVLDGRAQGLHESS